MKEVNNELGYRTLTECVMDYLKNHLNSGELRSGDEINLKTLSETLGVSRTPVREALIQLAKDGFIEIISRRVFRIKKLTLIDIKNMYQIIGLLEAEASKTAAEKITLEDIKTLEELYEGMKKFLEIDDFKTYLDLNIKTHSVITQYCENQILLETVSKLKERLYEFPKILINIPGWERNMMDDHYKMIEYLKNKDRKGLAELIQNVHWSFSRNYPFLTKYYDLNIDEQI
jgi:DNA-binding GntR family transcriptional regulator